jgi:hypothetical protein
MHLVPRNAGEQLQIHSRVPGEPEALAAVAGQLQAALNGDAR